MRLALVGLCLSALVGGVVLVAGDVPPDQVIPYQGVLEMNGAPVTGPMDFTFTLEDGDSSGQTTWSEAQTGVQVTQGRFSVELGSQSGGVPAWAFGTDHLLLRVSVGQAGGGQTPLSSAQRIHPVPYSVSAHSAVHASEATGPLALQLVPPGTIAAFGGAQIPDGWLLCDGTPKSADDYPLLAAALQGAWGDGGDVAGPLFNLPDLRGRFLRGVDDNEGVDPEAAGRWALHPGGNTGDKVGTYQDDMFASHSHNFAFGRNLAGGQAGPNIDMTGELDTTQTAGGKETRPKNAAVRYIIKY